MKQSIDKDDEKSVPIIPQATLDEMEKFFMKTGVFPQIFAEEQRLTNEELNKA